MWKHLAKGISFFRLTSLLSIKDEIKRGLTAWGQ